MLDEPPWNDPHFVAQGRRLITKEVGQLDAHLMAGGRYVTGSSFTIADIPIGLVVNRWFALDIDKPACPAVAHYYELLTTRPAYRKHVRNGLP